LTLIFCFQWVDGVREGAAGIGSEVFITTLEGVENQINCPFLEHHLR